MSVDSKTKQNDTLCNKDLQHAFVFPHSQLKSYFVVIMFELADEQQSWQRTEFHLQTHVYTLIE